ncbi:MAG TPA: hypothetical protein VK617_13770 [Gemmatimonadaceae bacterium]|nr:hypothetical protein [Gemmatimonadaceae bacterium]
MEQRNSDQTSGRSEHEEAGDASSLGATPSVDPRVYDRTRETPETMRERAVQLKTQLADKLETGATKLRKRSSDTEKLDDAIATTKERVADAGDRVASGMEKSAEWLRSANVTSFQQGLERQVKENPGRTLLIAGAIGYLLGRAFKGKDA